MAQQKTLFLCSRMDVLDQPGLRAQLAGTSSARNDSRFRLTIADRQTSEQDDARLFCARAIRESDGVILVLDDTPSTPRNALESTVLELEVMMAAAAGKPVVVLDFSNGTHRLFNLLGSNFFRHGQHAPVKRFTAANKDETVRIFEAEVSAILSGRSSLSAHFHADAGWTNLFWQRPDRVGEFHADGGNFPFATSAERLAVSLNSNEIDSLLGHAEDVVRHDKLQALVASWDAIRALSERPWASSTLPADDARRWLRALANWSGSMAWLGLFGHSSGAGIMAMLACRRIAARVDGAETRSDGPYAAHAYLGGLASNYFSLSKHATDARARSAMLSRGINYASDGLKCAESPRAIAGLLSVRGTLRVATKRPIVALGGFRDLQESVNLHKSAATSPDDDQGLATARIQLGAAYKHAGQMLRVDPVFPRLAHEQLGFAFAAMGGIKGPAASVEVGQYLMCCKHLVETLLLRGRRDEAREICLKAMAVADAYEVADQYNQLKRIAEAAGFLTERDDP